MAHAAPRRGRDRKLWLRHFGVAMTRSADRTAAARDRKVVVCMASPSAAQFAALYIRGVLRLYSLYISAVGCHSNAVPAEYARGEERLSVRSLTFATTLAMIGSVQAWAQAPYLAPEGRGLLPEPNEMPRTPRDMLPLHSFELDPSGGFSRTIFETDEDPNFKLVIREFSFPPSPKSQTLMLASVALLQILNGSGKITISNQRLVWTPIARTVVPAGTPIEIVNSGEQPIVVHALIVEAK